jgi:uncharacterized protein (AIM24 family)
MPESRGPASDPPEPQSRRLTPSIGLTPEPGRAGGEPDVAADSSNEDFLFHLYRGSELLQDNRVHDAKEELERALQLQPRDAQGQDLLAVVYFRLGLYPRAIAIFEQLRRKNPRDTALLLNLALCYLKTGQSAMARNALEQLLEINPVHARAWGYLGLACERIGDLVTAERAFRQGGHDQMARRIADRRAHGEQGGPPPAPIDRLEERGPPTEEDEESLPAREVREAREAVATAFKELDAGELSFAIAEPVDSPRDEQPESWKSIELGQPVSPVRETKKPDTKEGPPQSPMNALPQLALPASARNRRPTLIVGAAPAPDANHPGMGPISAHPVPKIVEEVPDSGVPGFDKVPSPRPPKFATEEQGVPSHLRRPVVAVPPIRAGRLEPPPETFEHRKTLPPPLHKPESALPPPPPPVSELAAQSSVEFPTTGGVVVHPSGVALVRTLEGTPGFSARLEAVRASANGLALKQLERQMKGKPTGESFGGVGSPMVNATGDGQLVLAARAGRKLSSFLIGEEMCFVREEVLLGFDGALAYENGRLATGEGELVAVVQLRGKGAVLIEGLGEIITLKVKPNKGMSVRREVVLGWFGRLVPRALAPSEAPCGQRGLVSFAGEGRVLVASA